MVVLLTMSPYANTMRAERKTEFGMLSNLLGRVAVVTGGAGAIGHAVVEAMARAGATVIAVDRTIGDNHQSASMRTTAWESHAMDVTSKEDIEAIFANIAKRHGALDILVNAAGIVSFGAARSLDEAEWDRVLDINLKGTFLCCQAAMPYMIAQRFGRIVNLGSVVGKNAGNARPWINASELGSAGNVAYGVSKAGVHILTAFLAKELAAEGVTVNAVAPGPIATGMTQTFPEALRALIPVGRMGKVEDVARAVVFLAAPEAGFITGEILDINGGMLCD
ncbi:SDR family NAD(P)-dependent oxidoreductase [Cupriavidus necator]